MRKFLALIMVVAMMASLATAAFAEDVTLPGEGLVANYSFDAAVDSLEVVGEAGGVTYEGGKAVFNGTAGLASNLDLGKFEALSVVLTFEVKNDITGSTWAFVIDGDESTNWDGRSFLGFNMSTTDFKSYASPKDKVWCGGNWTGYEGADTVGNMVKAGQTYTMVITLGQQTDGQQTDGSTATGLFHTMYLNGEYVQSWVLDGGNVSMADIFGDGSARLFIGMSNITHDDKYDELANNIAIDNLAVYNRALTADECAALSAAAPATATAPTVNVPTLSALGAGAPTTDAPTTDAPTTNAPATDAPAKTGAPKTGFATIALAIAAIGSGAYIVSKKH